MKVGVLTFHRSTNFGTMLQAHATVEAIEAAGAEAEIIDYRPEYIERTFRKKREIKTPKQLLSVIYNKVIFGNAPNRKLDHFMEYIGNLKIASHPCFSIDDLVRSVQDYDVILSGSDQLWNKNITGYDMAYFFPFEHTRKISLSSSFGTRTISAERSSEIAPYLREFRCISVREKTAKNILDQMKDDSWQADINITLDPTLFLSKEEWSKYQTKVKSLPLDGYILTYYMIETPLLRQITEVIKKQTGLPTVNIKPSKRQMIFHEGINLPDLGPGEFLSCYAGARYVVTNSFHGTAFAVNYGIPVYVSPLPVSMAGEVNSRLVDLLETFVILDRWIDTPDKLLSINTNESMDVSTVLNENREASKTILRDMICGEDAYDGK